MDNFLKLSDLSCEEITAVLDLADELKRKKKEKIEHKMLKDKTLGMIFKKSSTRTRVSFEVGMYELGGNAIFLSSDNTQMGRGEPAEDTARVLSRYLDGIMIRTYEQEEVETLAKFASIPIINGLTDLCHPCQVAADLMTIREYKKELNGKKLCYIGDGNNMANSLIVGAVKTGMQISVACPGGYEPDDEIVRWAEQNGSLTLSDDPQKCAKDADVLYTDVWTSMGMESEIKERREIFAPYQINDEIMSLAKDDAMVLHCLPAHKEEEITEKVFEKHADEIFEQSENRLHVQKAIMVMLMADR
ncbi:MAG: ornithine carbamoyltransferase [Oscillospiraceae bacterium]|nr:ornithine carbamoyltransferase [Oscillospiraceae bacterium]